MQTMLRGTFVQKTVSTTLVIGVLLIAAHVVVAPKKVHASGHAHRSNIQKLVHAGTHMWQAVAQVETPHKHHSARAHQHEKKFCASFASTFACPSRNDSVPDGAPAAAFHGNSPQLALPKAEPIVVHTAALPPPRHPLDEKIKLLI